MDFVGFSSFRHSQINTSDPKLRERGGRETAFSETSVRRQNRLTLTFGRRPKSRFIFHQHMAIWRFDASIARQAKTRCLAEMQVMCLAISPRLRS